jgi:hypothetical protein
MECENDNQRADSAEQSEDDKIFHPWSENRVSEPDYTFKSLNNQSRGFMFNKGLTVKSTGSGSSPKNKSKPQAFADGMSIRSAIWSKEKIKEHQRPESCNNCHTR